tara:strand:+ start:282 stop:539 length:258 start_codon:yes stop_codon:yes gene_type:complete
MSKLKPGDIVKYIQCARRGKIIAALPDGSNLKERLVSENDYVFVVLCSRTHDHRKPPGKSIKVYNINTGKIKYYHSRNLTRVRTK